MPNIPGYRFADPTLPASPLSSTDLDELRGSLLLGEEDIALLRASAPVLEPHIDELLDVWYGFVGGTPHLLRYFSNADGEPQPEYLARVRARFGQWVRDTARAEYDETWLVWQLEIGRRHHTIGKNRTDGADAAPIIHFRHLVALTIPVVATMRPFLERGGHPPALVAAMHDAWRKAVLLTVILWSYPFVEEGAF